MTGETPTLKPAAKNPYDQEKWELVAEGDWLVGQRFEIARHAVLGRDSSCDITIPGTHLSRLHAELAVKGGALLIRDLKSSNGTYVNDRKVTETVLKPGDSVRFDVLRFKVHGPSTNRAADAQATMIRQPDVIKKTKAPKAPPPDKNWKTKPTAVGNRNETVQIPAAQKAVTHLWTALAVVVGLATIAGLGYLVTLL